MEKKKLLIVIISAILLIAICATIGISGVLSPYERQIRLGYKLLEQGNYEEAILAFDKAIEIDVKRDKAYIGKADVYVARCDGNTLEDIKVVLEIAYNYHYNDEAIVDGILHLAGKLIDKEKMDWAIELLDYGYELTQSEKIKKYVFDMTEKLTSGLLQELYELYLNNDYEGVYKKIVSSECKYLEDLITDENYITYVPKNSDSYSVGIYRCTYDKENEVFQDEPRRFGGKLGVYFGTMDDGIRVGNGKWITGISSDISLYTCFEGIWENDVPNGKGKVTYYDGGSEEMFTEVAEGNFENGFMNGPFILSCDYGEEKWVYNQISATMGTLDVIEYLYDSPICGRGYIVGNPDVQCSTHGELPVYVPGTAR